MQLTNPSGAASGLRGRAAAALLSLACACAGPWFAAPAAAGVLPEDRADLLYHRYDGGGVVVDGPSVLVRKKFADQVSVVANYYLDLVSSASIDVISTASPYTDERTQMSLGLDYLRGKTTYSIGYIDGDESDYLARTAYLGISQDMFGDLTTISLGWRRGMNDVFRNIKEPVSGAKSRDPTFAQEMDTRAWSASLTQVLTRDLIGVLSYELVTDEGYLNNPYRQIRYADPTAPRGFAFAPELYPATKTSSAASARLKYSLPWWRAAVDGTYRFYTDTWGVKAQTLQLGYTQPAFGNWIFDARYRYYTQDAADFYRDLFPRRNTLNFQGRDKELSTYVGHTIGVGATWQFRVGRLPWLERGTVNLRYDYMMVGYDDFRDVTAGGLAGTEPLFELDASVIQFFVSAWF